MTGEPDTAGHRRAGLVPVLPRRAWVVLGSDFLSAIGSGLTLPFLFIYAHQVRDLSYGTSGLVVSTVALASLAGNPVGGALADRWTPRRALMAGLVIAAAGSVALAVAHAAVALFGTAAVIGFGVAMAWPAQDALLASLTGPSERSAVFSVRHACLNAGLALGALVAAGVVTVTRPGTFTAIYLADAATFVAAVLVLTTLRAPVQQAARRSSRPAYQGSRSRRSGPGSARSCGTGHSCGCGRSPRCWRPELRPAPVQLRRVRDPAGWCQHTGPQPGLRGQHANRDGSRHFALRWLAGCRRTTGAALAAMAWAATWTVVIIGGHLGHGVAAETAFAVAMVIFALGETLLSPTLPAIINDLAPPGAAGRYNGLGALAFTTGFLLGPAIGGAALGAGWGTGLFAVLVLCCILASVAALRLGRQLPLSANQVSVATAPEPVPADPAPVTTATGP